MAAYYNEIDPYAAQWLRNLIAAGHIAPGEVDERSIEDVYPNDLRGFTQCHFFAGVSVWSYALHRAGWPDDRPIWTGSCPCQPFSEAGQGAGFDDERHLWPHFHWLIQECRPAVVIGEQVASKDAEPWIDLVAADLEALDFAFGALAFPAAGVGSDHQRERTYWFANANKHGGRRKAATTSYTRPQAVRSANRPGGHSGLSRWPCAAVQWIDCADGKSRPTEPGVPVLVDEYPERVAQLRAIGNAIDAKAASVFIEAAMSCIP